MRDGLQRPGQRGHLLHFALPLGTKRALDFAGFFDDLSSSLAQLKRRQAGRFGACVTHLMRGDNEAAAGRASKPWPRSRVGFGMPSPPSEARHSQHERKDPI